MYRFFLVWCLVFLSTSPILLLLFQQRVAYQRRLLRSHYPESDTHDSDTCDVDATLESFRQFYLRPLVSLDPDDPQTYHCVADTEGDDSLPPAEQFALDSCGGCDRQPSLALMFLTREGLEELEPLWLEWLSMTSCPQCFRGYIHRSWSDVQTSRPSHPFFEEVPRIRGIRRGRLLPAENALVKAALRQPCNQMMIFLSPSHIPLTHPDVVYDILFDDALEEDGTLPSSRFCYAGKGEEREDDRIESRDYEGADNSTLSCGQEDDNTIGHDVKHHQWRAYNRYHAMIVAAQGLVYPYARNLSIYHYLPEKAASDEWYPHHVLRRALGNEAIWEQVNGGLTDWTGQTDPHLKAMYCDTLTCWNQTDGCGLGEGGKCSRTGPVCFDTLNHTRLAELIAAPPPLFLRKVTANTGVVDDKTGHLMGRVADMVVDMIRSQHDKAVGLESREQMEGGAPVEE
ncbi:unnamed protein product [Vitrella brassicaformis CCMP3155]|uniref:Uncharacterized protein n=1 Tax=Vitrella brassicaformis (strain CCMP3155) TaxID=1169540 RepID=A0A0G4GGK7_VITBC|nr:unnamed protein product [Vitrella brassicaformis CCMP3155]|eukprot:CEM28531.1 unnamed protein product [Vitrella brassicaformis CCMP3155]